MTSARIDFGSPQFRDNPYPALALLRATTPAYRHETGMLILTRHADVAAVNRDHTFGRDLRTWSGHERFRPYLANSALERCVEQWLFSLDPPEHTRLRRMMAAAFSPRSVAAMSAAIDSLCRRQLDALGSSTDVEFMTAFARPYPVAVIATILGLPAADVGHVHDWATAAARAIEPVTGRSVQLAADDAVEELQAYLRSRIATPAQPGTLLAALAPFIDSGDLGSEELVANLVLLFVAGHETTTNLLGNGLLALARHPEQLALLRCDPSLMPSAVEELLRYDGPANFSARVAHEPREIGGVNVEPGDLVMAGLGAANRDPAVFDRPDELDITRSPNPHVSFGGGVHFCLGASLARLEATIALRQVLDRWKQIDVEESGVVRRSLVNLRGLQQLPLRIRSSRPATRRPPGGTAFHHPIQNHQKGNQSWA